MSEKYSKPQNNVPDIFQGLFSFDTIWKLALLAFMVASLYLQNNFISKQEFALQSGRVHEIEKIIGQLEIKAKVDEQQAKTLELIEFRLRQVEQQTAILVNKANGK
jgi:hypothetical protein